MQVKPKWIVFDVGGVLFDGAKAFSKIAQYLEIDIKQINQGIEEYLGEAEKGEVTFSDIWLHIMARHNKQKDVAKVLELWWDKNSWFSDTLKLVHDLHKSNYQLAILTNNWKGMGPKLKKTEFLKSFEHIFESSTLKMRKPDLEMYQHVEDSLKANGQEIFFIDDSIKNIEAAKNLSWHVLHYQLGSDQGVTTNNEIRKMLGLS